LRRTQALTRWQSRLQEESTAQAELVSAEQRLVEEQTRCTVRSPVAGVLVGFTGWSPGGFIGASQLLGAVSPDDALLVETQVHRAMPGWSGSASRCACKSMLTPTLGGARWTES